MKLFELIFWLSTGYLFFVYAGYGLLLGLINRFKRSVQHPDMSSEDLPYVALVIAAYNEEAVISEKIKNSLGLNYPKNKLKCYVIADGSTDKTVSIAGQFDKVRLLWSQERRGKSAAINRVMTQVTEPVTIFTDANVMLNKDAILNLVRHYQDPLVGAVSGEKRVVYKGIDTSAATEGLYWKYESYLKRQDAVFHTLVGAAGELFSIRTALYQTIPEDTLLDDFMISMGIAGAGYRIAYEPDAFALETPSAGIEDEMQRKIRISAGGVQSVLRLKNVLNPIPDPKLFFQYIIHRFSRWILTPWLIGFSFISNAFLLGTTPFWTLLFCLQVLFHLSGLAGWLLERRGIRLKVLYIPFYFDFMHLCIVLGWIRHFSGRQSVQWKKAERHTIQYS